MASPEQQTEPEQLRPLELPPELREAFARTGYGCIASETNLGVVHVCHASDQDIEGFANKPVAYQWQLALMPTAPLLRLGITIFDQPDNPYRFESFFNTSQEPDIRAVEQLGAQEQLYLAFHGEDLTHRYTKVFDHSQIQRDHLQRLAGQAADYWPQIPESVRDFEQAKAEFQRRFPLLERKAQVRASEEISSIGSHTPLNLRRRREDTKRSRPLSTGML